jgi:hypothetical protein
MASPQHGFCDRLHNTSDSIIFTRRSPPRVSPTHQSVPFTQATPSGPIPLLLSLALSPSPPNLISRLNWCGQPAWHTRAPLHSTAAFQGFSHTLERSLYTGNAFWAHPFAPIPRTSRCELLYPVSAWHGSSGTGRCFGDAGLENRDHRARTLSHGTRMTRC